MNITRCHSVEQALPLELEEGWEESRTEIHRFLVLIVSLAKAVNGLNSKYLVGVKQRPFVLRSLWLELKFLGRVLQFTTLHYVMGVGGLKTRIALRQHYEGGWVGHIDLNVHYVVYGQPLTSN